MRRRAGPSAVVAVLLAGAAPLGASAPDQSLRPLARTVPAEAVPAARPSPRPEIEVSRAAPPARTEIVATSGLLRSPRPEARGTPPKRQAATSAPRAAAPQPAERVRPASAGARTNPLLQALRGRPAGLCGTNDIEGVRLQPITGRLRGCTIGEPVRVSAIAGVGLTQDAIMDCPTALALRQWVTGAAIPATGKRGGGLKTLRVAAHYACRTRNNQKGARLSEHGKGRAIDISGLVLANGETITVLRGWRKPGDGKLLRTLHQAACGPFGTVLGPNADRFHQDHFHFDTARYRSGSYCR